jgi:arylsulfatase A-like enzyme
LWSAGLGSDPINLYAEAVETPMIWNWPGKVPVEGARSELAGSYDLFPTLCELAGGAKDRSLCGGLSAADYQPAVTAAKPWRNLVFASYGGAEIARTP